MVSELLGNRRIVTSNADDGILDIATRRYQDKVSHIIKRADETLLNTFRLLGFPPHRFDGRIEWEKDFVADVAWERSYYLAVPIIMWGNNSDFKVPWELSRGHYLVWLAEAWRFTRETKYVEKLVSLIEDWITENPYPYGINWTCPMEAAVRIINWLATIEIANESEIITPAFAREFYRTIYQHATYIEQDIKGTSEGANNSHYLADLLGLLAAGSLFNDLPRGAVWREFAVDEFEKKITTQTLEDGFSCEWSLNYHLLASEIYLLAYIIESRTGAFSDDYRKRLRAMFHLIHSLLKPDGTLPNFGDGDSGRILVFDGYDNPDPAKLLDIAALVLDSPELRSSKPRVPYDSLWLIDRRISESADISQHIQGTSNESKLFPESGLATLRKDDWYLFFGANPIGSIGVGGHKHNDMLTIEISCGQTNYIVDSGTYTYTSDQVVRNRFRSTCYHSVPAVRDIEQNRFIPRMVFAIRPDADVKINLWKSNEMFDLVEAENSAYTRLPEPLLILRSIYFDKTERFWIIKDSFYGHGKFDLVNNLVLGDVTPDILSDSRISLKSSKDNSTLEIVSLSHGWLPEIVAHEISLRYGEKKDSLRIVFSCNSDIPVTMVWVAIPLNEDQIFTDRMNAASRKVSELGLDITAKRYSSGKLTMKGYPNCQSND